ncbi:rod shape-determining protein MreC [Rickettsiales bacterium]|nr:rod shape-determining protein MreC [Rickettsiales bacterium]
MQYNSSRNNFSIAYILSSIYQKIETKLFIILSILFLIISSINKEFNDKISMIFVEVTLPVSNFISYPFSYVINISTNISDLINSKEENEKLKKENEELKKIFLESLKIKEENQYLKDLINYVNLRSSNHISSRIIGRSNKTYSDSVFIEIGSNHDIKQDSVVIGKYAMIGRVSQIGNSKSRILLPTDINSHIPIITSRSKNRGILKGNNSDIMEILYLNKDHGLQSGDMIFTSGDGDSLPYGILVGQVTKIDEDKVYAKMIEDINRVDIVTIIQY